MNKQKYLFLISILIFVLASFAELPNTVVYRGQLTDDSGNALDATVDITFNIFDIASGGSSLWSETQSAVVTDGYFDVELGSVTALDLNFDNQYWVELTIGGETLTPRDKLTPTAYSIRSNIANKADSSIYSVSSSADHTGRTGHIRFVPGDGSVVTEASASSETDTIYIAIGGSGAVSSGGSYPPANVYISANDTITTEELLYTVPTGKQFLVYGAYTSINSYHYYNRSIIEVIRVNADSDTIKLSVASMYGASGVSTNSTPHVVNFNPPIQMSQGEYITLVVREYYKYSGTIIYNNASIWGYESDI